MKKANTARIILELVTIFSFIFIGVSVLTFLAYPAEIDVKSKSLIGSIVLAIGTTELVEFLSLNYLNKRRNIPNVTVAILSMILGIVLMAASIELRVVCLIWAIAAIVFQVIKVINSGFNIMKQPFLNIIIILLCIIETVFCVYMIVNRESALIAFFTFLGISLLVEAFILIVEFIIHRYQK